MSVRWCFRCLGTGIEPCAATTVIRPCRNCGGSGYDAAARIVFRAKDTS